MDQEPKETGQDDNQEMEVFDVIELESDEGESESFVIMDTVVIKKQEYAILMLLSDLELIESMSEEEFKTMYGEEPCFQLMRKEDDYYVEVRDDEYESIADELEAKLEEMSK